VDPRLEAELKEMVLPLLGMTRDGALHGIGTTFVIGCSGRTAILLTAAHNVEAIEQLDAPRQRFHPSTPPEFRPKRKPEVFLKTTRVYALYDRDGRSHLCPVGQFWFLPELDIAICWTDLDGSDAAADLMFRYKMRIASRPLPVGTPIMAVGYPELTTDNTFDSESPSSTVKIKLTVRNGQITALHPTGTATAPWPAFRTNVAFDPGMSGGPIISLAGDKSPVCGIVCRDMSSEAPPEAEPANTSIGSMIWPGLLIKTTMSLDLEPDTHPTVADLIRLGVVEDLDDGHKHTATVVIGDRSVHIWRE
jgi:hypothetical protein